MNFSDTPSLLIALVIAIYVVCFGLGVIAGQQR